MQRGFLSLILDGSMNWNPPNPWYAWPKAVNRAPLPIEVPEDFAADYMLLDVHWSLGSNVIGCRHQ